MPALVAAVLLSAGLAAQDPIPPDCLLLSTPHSAFRMLDANWNVVVDQWRSASSPYQGSAGPAIDEHRFLYNTKSDGGYDLCRFGDSCDAFTFTNERPFESFGNGCANGAGLEPRMGWAGLPLQGQTFSITLRDAEPNGIALFWLGLNDVFWNGIGPLPFDAGPWGAPGCTLWVAAEAAFPAAVDGSGQARLQQAVPVNPALTGLQVFAQSASSSTANAFGFSSSDALVIRVR